ILDPACGSGTFLVLAIKRARLHADANLLTFQTTIQQILKNIVGFDLNPLAVIAARTNYLLALGTLVRYQSPLEIPVYLCDSVLTPAGQQTTEQGLSGQFTQETFFNDYAIPTTVGLFHVPRTIVTQEELPTLAAILEDCVRHNYTRDDFLARARQGLRSLSPDTALSIQELFDKMLGLQRDGRDGI